MVEHEVYKHVPQAKGTPPSGLSIQAAEAYAAQGKINVTANPQDKSVARIFSENICTLFNAVNVVLAALVFCTGSYRNMLFMVVVFCNVAIGIVQEVRARHALKKLSLLVSDTCTVVRAGVTQKLSQEEIVLGDMVCLKAGAQVPCDCRVVTGAGDVSEALLTGESNLVHKTLGDALLSGSFVAAGSVLAEAVAVGEDSFAAHLARQVKTYKKPKSQIMSTLQYIIKMATFYMIPVGILLFLRTYFDQGGGLFSDALNSAILTTTAALIGMIPQGLILLTSAVLTLSVIRLASKKVLVKQFYSVEMLARVDVLCLDKTGTITTGEMRVAHVYPAEDLKDGVASDFNDEKILQIAACAVAADEDAMNQTARAIVTAYEEKRKKRSQSGGGKSADGAPLAVARSASCASVESLATAACSSNPSLAVARSIPFVSERKYAGCVLETGEAYVVGAPEFIFSNDQALYEQQEAATEGLASSTSGVDPSTSLEATLSTTSGDTSETSSFVPPSKTERLVCVAQVPAFTKEGKLEGAPKLLGWIGLLDELRPGIESTLSFFKEQGVRLLVLSGDNPKTAAAIAAKAGLEPQPGQTELIAVDARKLAHEDLVHALESVSVVGRCTPAIKQEIIAALQTAGHTAAMTGDGVNDILAMHTADTSVAMAQGAQAARAVADIVLADNNFSHMPKAVAEGRRSINNLIRSASLFLEKTVFSMALAAFALILPPYPLLPIQLTLVSAALIGIPSFILALEPNYQRVEGSFFKKVFSKSLPASFAISLSIAGTMALGALLSFSSNEIATIATFIICAVGLALLVHIARPLNAFRTALISGVTLILIVCAACFGWFFELVPTSVSEGGMPLWALSAAFSGAALVLYVLLVKMLSRWLR